MTVKPIICVDFDGVLNDYHGYKGSDELYKPLTGAKEFLQKLSEKYTIIILSARTPAKIYDWLIEHDLSKYVCDVTRVKPGAVAYIDDRSIRFDGNYHKVLYELERFKTHWEKEYTVIGDGRYTNPTIDENGNRFQLAYEEKGGWWAVNDNDITLWKEEVIYELNSLAEENKELKEENEYLCEKIKENEWHWNTIDEDRDVWKHKCKTLEEEKTQLKSECEAYKTLYEQMSYYFEEGKTLKDLDKIDFRTLQRLAKGLVD